MTDRERLIELFSPFADGTYNSSGTIVDGTKVDDIVDSLLANGVRVIDTKVINPENRELITHFAGMPINDVLDLVRAKKEERLILPPCKVGDVVYSSGYDWQKAKDVVTPYQITNITITQNKKGVWTKKYRAMRVLNGKTIDCQLNFEFDTIGKTVFLTKEEAEAKLKELNNND